MHRKRVRCTQVYPGWALEGESQFSVLALAICTILLTLKLHLIRLLRTPLPQV